MYIYMYICIITYAVEVVFGKKGDILVQIDSIFFALGGIPRYLEVSGQL